MFLFYKNYFINIKKNLPKSFGDRSYLPFCRRSLGFSFIFKLVLLAFSTSSASALTANNDSQRLTCFFYDQINPYTEMSPFHVGLASVWAKGLKNENILVSGTAEDGFFIAHDLSGKVHGLYGTRTMAHYENSQTLAEAFCRRGLQYAFPDSFHSKILMHMAVKSSFLSVKHTPVVFSHHRNSLIGTIDKLVVFGDSLSDQDNIKTWLRVFPRSPYFAGRFSNLSIWVDYLQRNTGIAIQNWAFGGSVSDLFNDLEIKNKSLKEKVVTEGRALATGSVKGAIARYQANALLGHPLMHKDTTLFSLWTGANDYISIIDKDSDVDIFIDFPDDKRVGSKIIINAVVNNVIDNLEALIKMGGRNFLIPNLPDLGVTPHIMYNTTYHKKIYESNTERVFNLSIKMTEIVSSHNKLLREKIDATLKKYPDIKITFVDIETTVNHALKSISIEDGMSYFDYDFDTNMSTEFTLNNKTIVIRRPCYTGNAFLPDKGLICVDPHRNFFWDDLHPTTYSHCLIAAFLHKSLADDNVIKPSSLNNYLELCRPDLLN